MLNKLKSIAKDTAWLTIGATASVVYITYKAVDRVVRDVPEMMDFAQDTYSQAKVVITKVRNEPPPLTDEVIEQNQELYNQAVKHFNSDPETE